MNTNSSPRNAVAATGLVLLLLLGIGAAGIIVAGGGATRIYDPLPANATLSADEDAYVAYVGPRLQELVDEMTQVTTLVRQRSRNIIKLNTHGVRITTLAAEIQDYGDQYGVPRRFATVDASIRDGCKLATDSIQEARDTLITFDFSAIPALIPKFTRGSQELTAALTELRDLARVGK